MSTAPADYYYDAQGNKIILTREPQTYAVRFTPGKRSDDPSLTVANRRFLREQSEHISFVPNYNFQIYKSRFANAGESVQRLRSLEAENIIQYASPAFRRSGNPTDLAFLTNRFIVEFKEGVAETQATEFLSRLNALFSARIVEKLAYTEPNLGYLVETQSVSGEHGCLAAVRRYFEEGSNLLKHVTPDLVQRRTFRQRQSAARVHDVHRARSDTPGAPDWEYQTDQWHLAKVGLPEAWERFGLGDPNITIAIADDGVDGVHPEFVGKIVGEFDFANHVENGNPKLSIDNHGTACAGVAAASGIKARGSAPRCSLMSVRLPDYMGVADEASMFAWMKNNGADVISCSWGPPDGTGAAYPLAENVRTAINYCVTRGRQDKGIPIFWAAGNGAESVSADGYAANPDVIAVAACTENDSKAHYSDSGPEIFLCAPSSGNTAAGDRRVFTTDRSGPEGYNPGGNVQFGDTIGDYSNDFGGTSAAAPLAAGVAALMLSRNSELTVGELKQKLSATCDKIGGDGIYDGNGHNQDFGHGRINALRAVESAAESPTTPATEPQPGVSSIQGPESADRSAPAPILQITLPPDRYFAVELATRSELFHRANHQAERSDDNFYASWQENAFLSGQTYTMPAAVWQRLRHAQQVAYRMWTSTQPDAWVNQAVTIPDSNHQSAPFVRLTSAPAMTASTIQGPERMSRPGSPPIFQISLAPGRFYAVEVSIDPGLFNGAQHGAERSVMNFYASWQELPFLSGSSYELPLLVWERLSRANAIYYRMWTSAATDRWLDPQVTVSSAAAEASAPSITITDC